MTDNLFFVIIALGFTLDGPRAASFITRTVFDGGAGATPSGV